MAGHPCHGVPSAKAPSASSGTSEGSVSAKGCQHSTSHLVDLTAIRWSWMATKPTASSHYSWAGTQFLLGRDLQNQQEQRKYQCKLRTEPDCYLVARGSRKPAQKDPSLYFCNRDINKTSNNERGNWIFGRTKHEALTFSSISSEEVPRRIKGQLHKVRC